MGKYIHIPFPCNKLKIKPWGFLLKGCGKVRHAHQAARVDTRLAKNLCPLLTFEYRGESGLHAPCKSPMLRRPFRGKMSHLPFMVLNESTDISVKFFTSGRKYTRLIGLFQYGVRSSCVVIRLVSGAMAAEMADIKGLETLRSRSILNFREYIRAIHRCSEVRIVIYPFFD